MRSDESRDTDESGDSDFVDLGNVESSGGELQTIFMSWNRELDEIFAEFPESSARFSDASEVIEADPADGDTPSPLAMNA